MRILIIGGTGVLGQSIIKKLKESNKEYQIISTSRKSGDYKVDISSKESIENLFAKVGDVDHIIVAAGSAVLKNIEDINNDDIIFSVNNKMLGQVYVTLIGQNYVKKHGSITLIAGIIKDRQIKMGSMYALANGAVASFAKAAAFDIKKDIRINCISPTVFNESLKDYGKYFEGLSSVAVEKVAEIFIKTIEGQENGQEILVY